MNLRRFYLKLASEGFGGIAKYAARERAKPRVQKGTYRSLEELRNAFGLKPVPKPPRPTTIFGPNYVPMGRVRETKEYFKALMEEGRLTDDIIMEMNRRARRPIGGDLGARIERARREAMRRLEKDIQRIEGTLGERLRTSVRESIKEDLKATKPRRFPLGLGIAALFAGGGLGLAIGLSRRRARRREKSAKTAEFLDFLPYGPWYW